MTDFELTNHGSLFTLRALSTEAKDWVSLNLPEDFMGYIEPRYVTDIVTGATEEGLTFQ